MSEPLKFIHWDAANADRSREVMKAIDEAHAHGINVLTSAFLPPGVAVIVPKEPAFLEMRQDLVPIDDEPYSYNVRLYAKLHMPPPSYFAVLTNIDGSPWPEPVNTRPRTRKNPARSTWGHQRP